MGETGSTPSERRRSQGLIPALAAGVIIGAVECVLAIAFAAFVFGGLLASRLPDGIGLYLFAAVLTLAILAWRAGRRGVVGSVQDAAAAVLGIVAASSAAKAASLRQVAASTGLQDYEAPDVFLTVIAATLVVTVLCGGVFSALGTFRIGSVVRFMPYPVIGGFLAGTGWLLLKGGIYVASGVQPALRTARYFIREPTLIRWAPAFVFGAVLLGAVRIVKRPLVIPTVLAVGVVAFAVGMVVTGSSIDEARDGRWFLGPFESVRLWQPWTLRALGGADWSSVLDQWSAIVSAVLVASLALLLNVSGTEVVLGRDLDTNRELRDAGVLNVVSGALGGIPGYHALSLTALAQRMSVNARTAGFVAAAVPLTAVVFGASVIELIPRMLVGGVLVFLGLAFIVEWVWDKRKVLPKVEYLIVLVILAGVIAVGFLPAVALGLVMAVVLFAVNYGRIEQVREVTFGDTYRSNVDRSASERQALREMSERIQVLRLTGFVFFGSASALLARIRQRVERAPLRFLVMDLRRVSGVDSSAVVSFVKIAYLAEANGFELVLAGASDRVREQLERGGVRSSGGVVTFVPDLDRGLQRCEDAFLAEAPVPSPTADEASAAEMPPALGPYLKRESLPEGSVLMRQDEPPTDVLVLASGRLRVEAVTSAGTRMRLRTIRPGVVVGEVAMYTGAARTADVVADTPVDVLRLSADAIERIESEDPELAAAVHRWLARTIAERLAGALTTYDALID
jgi:SulP family sulfate permease